MPALVWVIRSSAGTFAWQDSFSAKNIVRCTCYQRRFAGASHLLWADWGRLAATIRAVQLARRCLQLPSLLPSVHVAPAPLRPPPRWRSDPEWHEQPAIHRRNAAWIRDGGEMLHPAADFVIIIYYIKYNAYDTWFWSCYTMRHLYLFQCTKILVWLIDCACSGGDILWITLHWITEGSIVKSK